MKTFRPTLEHVVMAGLVVAGMVAVNAPIGDNSMFIHLRTGIDMVESWSIPRSDPYSFTARGEPWIVQSWLPEAIYGLLHNLGGDRLVIVLHMLLGASAATVMVLLARSTSMLRTLVAGTLPIALAWFAWTQRPLLFGVLCFALLIYVTVRQRSMWWLLPIAWVWVNSHGSFPIGIAWLGAYAIGMRLDAGVFNGRTIRYAATFVGGVILGAVNPLGPKLLLFFTTAIGERAKSFADIVEWGSPSFHSISGVALALVLVAIVAIGFRSKVSWRYGLPVLGLLVASLYSSRHLSMLAVAICPLLSEALSSSGEPASADNPRKPANPTEETRDARIAGIALALMALVGTAMIARTFTQSPYAFDMYPIAALDRIEEQGLRTPQTRMLSRETTGCIGIWRDGKNANVFIDDRIDMYPADVSTDYRHLFHGDAAPQPLLDKYRIDVVLWDTDSSLANTLSVDPRWRVAFTEGDWSVFVRA